MDFDSSCASVSYMNWWVKEVCFNGDEQRDGKIWSAYNAMKLFYGTNGHDCSGDFHDENQMIAFYGACGACCSILIEDEKPEPIMAAFLYGPTMDHDCPDAYLDMIEHSFTKTVRQYIEAAIELIRTTNLVDYNKLLAQGLPEEVLAIEVATLRCTVERLILTYQNTERTPTDEFERYEKLLLRVDDQVASGLLLCYNRIAVLLNYVKLSWRGLLINAKVDIAWVTEMVYDTTFWPVIA